MMQGFLPFYKLPYETRGEENIFVLQCFIKYPKSVCSETMPVFPKETDASNNCSDMHAMPQATAV